MTSVRIWKNPTSIDLASMMVDNLPISEGVEVRRGCLIAK